MRRILSVTTLLLAGIGCATVQPVRQPAQYIPTAHPELVVVIYKDNSQAAVTKPQISGDTLIGMWAGEQVAVPLSDVQRIDAMQKSPRRTAMMVAGLAVLAAGGTYAVVRVTQSGRNCDYSYQPSTLPAGGRCIDGGNANQ